MCFYPYNEAVPKAQGNVYGVSEVRHKIEADSTNKKLFGKYHKVRPNQNLALCNKQGSRLQSYPNQEADNEIHALAAVRLLQCRYIDEGYILLIALEGSGL